MYFKDFQTSGFTGFYKRGVVIVYMLHIDNARAKEHQYSDLEILKPHSAGFPLSLRSPG